MNLDSLTKENQTFLAYLKKEYLLIHNQKYFTELRLLLVKNCISVFKPQSAEYASGSSGAFQYPTITLQQSLIHLHGGNYGFVSNCCALSSL